MTGSIDHSGRRIELGELSATDVERWRELAARAVEPNAFFEPAFVRAAAGHLEDEGASLLVVEAGGVWIACLPVRRARLAGIAPALRSWCHLYCFLGTPLLDAGSPQAAAHALLQLALDSRGRPLVLDRLGADGPVTAALHAAARELGLEVVTAHRHERALLRRTAEGDRSTAISSHHRRELNRLGRRLEAQLDGARSVCDEAGDADAVAGFLELERSGWKGARETALAARPSHAAFFVEVCRAFAAEGRLELLTLRAGDRRVAMKCTLYSGEGGFCFKIAHDAQLRRFSPGVQLERENIRIFDARRSERWQDSCADPDNAMINRLWTDRRQMTTIMLSPPGVRATVSRHGAHLVQAVRTRARREPSTPS